MKGIRTTKNTYIGDKLSLTIATVLATSSQFSEASSFTQTWSLANWENIKPVLQKTLSYIKLWLRGRTQTWSLLGSSKISKTASSLGDTGSVFYRFFWSIPVMLEGVFSINTLVSWSIPVILEGVSSINTLVSWSIPVMLEGVSSINTLVFWSIPVMLEGVFSLLRCFFGPHISSFPLVVITVIIISRITISINYLSCCN